MTTIVSFVPGHRVTALALDGTSPLDLGATSGGVAAGIDLCLHLVRKDHGAEIANRLGRALVVGPHREGGQAQFIVRARMYLPGPHQAVRPLLASGWKVSEFDLYMASAPELIDPRRSVPAPGLA